jgi:hypothetical protein
VSERRDEIVAAGQLEEALVLAAKLARSAGTRESGEVSPPSDDLVLARIEETDSIRLAFQTMLQRHGYPREDLGVLTHGIAEVYDACRAYVRKVDTLLASPETDPASMAVDFASLNAGLATAENCLQDLRMSLVKLVEFLAR